MASPASRAPLLTRPFVLLGAATLAFFVQGGIVLPAQAPFAMEVLDADGLGTGIAIGAFAAASLVLRPFVGWASDRFGRRPLLVGGAALTILALALHLVVRDLPLFVAARALLGAAEGFFFVAVIAAASDMAPEERRGEALSFMSTALYLGVAIGPPVSQVVLDAGSFNAVWFAAIAMAVVALVLAALVPETAPRVLARAAGAAPHSRPRLLHPAGIFPGIVIMLGLWGMAGYLAYISLYAPAIGAGGPGPALALYALIVVALRVIGATWPDRFGAARLSGAALLVGAIGLAILGFVPTTVGLYAGTAIFAAGIAFTMPALLALAVSRVDPDDRGAVVGTATVFLDVVFALAPALLGPLGDAAGYGSIFLVSAAFALLASALLVAGSRFMAAPAAHATG
jgi:MFS family permease